MKAGNNKKVAILQSNYIPWKGYFDLINMVDEFIVYDQCQYTKNSWRNRNRIKSEHGLLWLTIPVRFSLSNKEFICDVKVSDKRWAKKHWKTIVVCYSKRLGFEYIAHDLEETYKIAGELDSLSEINAIFTNFILRTLGIKTKITRSEDYELSDSDATDRVVSMCRQSGAKCYLSGPAGQNYLCLEKFKDINCTIQWMDYGGYPEYNQPFPPFEHSVSVIDLIACVGPEKARNYMLSFPEARES